MKILQYFDGPDAFCPKLDVCCDNCRLASTSKVGHSVDDINKKMDFTKDAKILLDAIALFGGYSGISKPITVVRGSRAKNVERYHNHKLFGSGKHQSEEYWKILTDLLERQGLLYRQRGKNGSFTYTSVKIADRGNQWLQSGKPLEFVPSEQMLQLIASEKQAVATASAKPLYDTSVTSMNQAMASYQPRPNKSEELKRSLIVVRAMIASREGTMPYKIASEPAIDRLAQLQPLNLQELRDAKIEGFSETLIKQFGPEFLTCIQRSKGLLAPQAPTDNMVSQFA